METSEAKIAWGKEKIQESGFRGACTAKKQSLDWMKDKCWGMADSCLL